MKTYNVTVYQNIGVTGRTDWRWRMTARNGRIVGASTEGFRRREDCLKNFRAVTNFGVWCSSGRTRGAFKTRVSR